MTKHSLDKYPYGCGIYCIENIVNGKKYVGRAVNIHRRVLEHLNDLKQGKEYSKTFQSDWNEMSEENFIFYVVQEYDKSLLDDMEIYWIKELHSNVVENGYNISWGGKDIMRGVYVTDEHRKNLSIANSGERNAMYGKKLSPEHLAKMSASLKGHSTTEEGRMKAALSSSGARRKSKNSSSQYLGVNKHTDGGFVVRLANAFTGERLYLGYYQNEVDAAMAFDEKSWELYHNPLKLNFPENYK